MQQQTYHEDVGATLLIVATLAIWIELPSALSPLKKDEPSKFEAQTEALNGSEAILRNQIQLAFGYLSKKATREGDCQ